MVDVGELDPELVGLGSGTPDRLRLEQEIEEPCAGDPGPATRVITLRLIRDDSYVCRANLLPDTDARQLLAALGAGPGAGRPARTPRQVHHPLRTPPPRQRRVLPAVPVLGQGHRIRVDHRQALTRPLQLQVGTNER
ncbi:hypothetical protein [Streptomyces sp. NRRL S-237]|uniref:hypothetical protein n=1 Tax=Streptomyces sp. NRRL S-237 TaxID=1463895 RepID=UPI0004C96985|nr:hypothetical protein [Streptomyces sp. NRRL S-237]